jgi:hypothetical protein
MRADMMAPGRLPGASYVAIKGFVKRGLRVRLPPVAVTARAIRVVNLSALVRSIVMDTLSW